MLMSDLTEEEQSAFEDWRMLDLPLYMQSLHLSQITAEAIRYTDLNRENVIEYSFYDIVLLLESWYLLAQAGTRSVW